MILSNCGSEKTFESPLNSKDTKPINPKINQLWIFIGRTDVEAEAPILWPPDLNSRLIRKDLDAGKGWGQEKKGSIEDEMVGWHYQSVNMSLSIFQEMLKDREAWHAAVPEVTKSRTWLRDRTATVCLYHVINCSVDYFWVLSSIPVITPIQKQAPPNSTI